MAVVVALLLALAAADGAAVVESAVVDGISVDARCARLRLLVAEPVGAEGLARGAALLGGALGERLAREAGRATVDAAWELLTRATQLRCGDDVGVGVDDGDTIDIAALARDPRFHGVRADDDLGDRLFDRAFAWLQGLLESDAMLAFSERTRTVYLTGLAVAGVVVAWRLRRRRRPVQSSDSDVTAATERRRVQAFSSLRHEAIVAIEDAPRTAMVLLRQALLARVGEIDADAARPSRTANEILARVSTSTAAAVQPALLHFDARFYAGLVDVEAATTLLQLVDDGVARLARGRR